MTRSEKYTETRSFHFYNHNPKGRLTTDCVIRAISFATGIPYNDVVMDLARLQCETGRDDGEAQLYGKYLASKGWVKHKQPRKTDNTKYTGKEWCKRLTESLPQSYGPIIAHIGGHHIVAIAPVGEGARMKFKVHDTWNSTGGCIGNYWTKHTEEIA